MAAEGGGGGGMVVVVALCLWPSEFTEGLQGL